MKYIATLFLVLMTLAFVVCGILLWRRRHEPQDYSRTIQALFSWVSAFFTLTFIFRTWLGTTTADSAFFEPEHTFVPFLMQMTFFLYPLEVMRPTVSRTLVYALLFSPLLLLVFIGLCTGIVYTPIYTYADLWSHLGEFNVWFRLLALLVMLFYAFSLFLVPYDWRRSSADKKFITRYACGFCLIGLIHLSIQMSHAYVLVLLHQVAWFGFFLSVTYYELKERLLVMPSSIQPVAVNIPTTPDDEIWDKISHFLLDQEQWCSPDLSLNTLCVELGSNRTYVGEAFRRNVGQTFIKYITNLRIDYVMEVMKSHPDADINQLLTEVGYRNRSTAWRNFHKVTGITPAEFVEQLRSSSPQ